MKILPKNQKPFFPRFLTIIKEFEESLKITVNKEFRKIKYLNAMFNIRRKQRNFINRNITFKGLLTRK